MPYTHLVLACGSAANLGDPGWLREGIRFQTVTDAMVMENYFIGNFAAAATETEQEARQRLLTAVVIGGGFSGVGVRPGILRIRCMPAMKLNRR